MGVLLEHAREVAEVVRLSRRQAQDQAGILSGQNPAQYNASDPIRLWVIQVVLIIAFTQILHYGLHRLREPKVISEIIAGVILGPTIMGRIPGFSDRIFPQQSIPLLNLTATIGLVLFLFIVGMELDVRLVKRNAKASSFISGAGLVIPLGLGAALGIPLYHEFVSADINFGYFLLFVAVAVGITAFPVLCRILTEIKLLDTPVGIVALSAGVGNDVIGWVLLALAVALVNASTGVTAVYVLLVAVGFTLFMLLPVRWGYRWLCRRSGSLEKGHPTAFTMTVTIIMVFFSAFFTDIIGIHAIFGGFIAGLVIPHENGYALSLIQKLEDLVALLFLPLYFALSGLRTNMGLLDNGITWGYTVLVCVVSFFSKFLGCAITAKLFGFTTRQSGAIGSLMACKGLVEIIVLNVGLQAGILDTRLFSMFVLHALVLTFITAPLVILWYPERIRDHAAMVTHRRLGPGGEEVGEYVGRPSIDEETFITKVAVVLERVEELPAVMTFLQLFQNSVPHVSAATEGEQPPPEKKESSSPSSSVASAVAGATSSSLVVDALRLVELSDRMSAVFSATAADFLITREPILAIIRTFGYLHRMVVSAAFAIVSWDDYPSSVATHVSRSNAPIVIIPWSSGIDTETQPEAAPAGEGSETPHSGLLPSGNPFDALFGQKTNVEGKAVIHSEYVRRVFTQSPADVALFIDRGLPPTNIPHVTQHIFLPFFGGPDDRLALHLVVQLCMSPSMTATVIRYTKVDSDELSRMNTVEQGKAQQMLTSSILNTNFGGTALGSTDPQDRLQSDTADDILWDRYVNGQVPSVSEAMTRISFERETTSLPLHAVVDASAELISQKVEHNVFPLVILGRSRRMAVESHAKELRQLLVQRNVHMSSEVPKTLGAVGAAFVSSDVNTSLIVVQAANH